MVFNAKQTVFTLNINTKKYLMIFAPAQPSCYGNVTSLTFDYLTDGEARRRTTRHPHAGLQLQLQLQLRDLQLNFEDP